MANITGLMATSPNGVVGNDLDMVWSIPEELEFFRSCARGNILLMGRKTFDTTPHDFLSQCHNIVFSKDLTFKSEIATGFTDIQKGIDFAKELEHKLKTEENLSKSLKIFMIGGADMANLFLKNNLLSSFYLSILKESYSGNKVLNMEYLKPYKRSVIKEHQKFTVFDYTLQP